MTRTCRKSDQFLLPGAFWRHGQMFHIPDVEEGVDERNPEVEDEDNRLDEKDERPNESLLEKL